MQASKSEGLSASSFYHLRYLSFMFELLISILQRETVKSKNRIVFTKKYFAALACNNRKPIRKENINKAREFVDSKTMLYR